MNTEQPQSLQPPLDEAQAVPAPDRLITQRFSLRGGFLDVRRPYDLKSAEAVRLAQFIESPAAG